MNDLFDQEITDGLHRAAARIVVPGGSFSDIRRRVRARRGRHVAAAVAPAVAGMAWVGMRVTAPPTQPSLGMATDSSADTSDPAGTASIEPSPGTTVTFSTQPTDIPTTKPMETAPTISPDLLAGVVCIDASAPGDATANGCFTYVPNARVMRATPIIIADTPMFLVPLDPAYEADARTLGDLFGLPVRPDITAHLQQDLAGTDLSGVWVFMVIGTTDATTCTIPGCTPGTTYPMVSEEAWAEKVARSAAVFEALGFPAGEPAVGESDVVQVHAVDPTRPDERQITLTIRPGIPEFVTDSTMSSAEHDGRVVVVRQASDGWSYELEVVDTADAGLPTGDQVHQLLFTTFG